MVLTRRRPGWRPRLRMLTLAAAAALAAVLALLLAVPHPSPSLAEVVPFQPDQIIRIEGQGWGHGVGMSQWGARGRALAGQTADQIVLTYYTGVDVIDAPTDQTPIRVLISNGYQPASFDGAVSSSNLEQGDIIGVGGAWAISGATDALPPGARLRLLHHPGERRVTVRLLDAAGQHMLDFDLPGQIEVVPLQPETRLLVQYKVTPPDQDTPGQHFDLYRGSMRVYVNAEGLIDTVNVLSLEDYLLGVVPAEMPRHWPAEALKAQAMAARTYALTSLRPDHPVWDVVDTTQDQVYLGVNHEAPETTAAVQATARRVIAYQNAPIRSYFFSTANGHTEANEDVFGDAPQPYLRPVVDLDPSGRPWDADSPLSTWSTAEFPLGVLRTLVPGPGDAPVGDIRSLDFGRRTASGRMIDVGVEGPQGSRRIGAWDFVARFNRRTAIEIGPMYSTRFILVFAYPLTRSVEPLDLPDGQSIYFADTGHNVRHGFLKYFNARGGQAAFGRPLTEEFVENGRVVQYFERARFEYHPELAGTPYETQLGLINDTLTAPRRPFDGDEPFPSVPQHRYFPETGHSVHYGFLQFWETQGGLDRFGYPISQEVVENGRTVQHFQRARLVWAPDAPSGQNVQLADVGTELLRARGLLPP